MTASESDNPPSPPRGRFASEPGSDRITRRIEELRAAGEALDVVLRDAKRFVGKATMAGARHLLLVVDDDEDARTTLALGLQDLGFQVQQASDGADAVAKARAALPDAIVMDYSMPTMDGGEAARELAGDERTRRIPILLLSGYPEVIPRDVRLGCAAFLAKPCEAGELGALLHLMVAAS
ncbi:MAG TPA: response regulator [Polyangiaceae bacterium]